MPMMPLTPDSPFGDEKEGSLSEALLPPCWYSLSIKSPAWGLHEVSLETAVRT